MTISDNDAFRMAIIPGAAEALAKRSKEMEKASALPSSSRSQTVVARVTDFRDYLYLSTALLGVAAVGAALSDPNNTTTQYTYAAISTLGVGLITVSASKLRTLVLDVQRTINSGGSFEVYRLPFKERCKLPFLSKDGEESNALVI